MSATTEQRMVNLARANQVRVAHATIRRNITAAGRTNGAKLVCDLLTYPSGHVPTIRIRRLLAAIPTAGDMTVDRWMRIADIRSDKRVEQLTDRQRLALVMQIAATVQGGS